LRAVVTVLLGLALLLAPLYAAIPDDPLPIGSSWLCAAIFAAALIAVAAARRGDRTFWLRPSRAEKAFLVLLGLAFLSIPARLIVQHGTGYFGPMLRGWAVLATDFAAFALARRVAGERVALYALAFAAVLASGYVSEQGILEDLPFLLRHQTSWRVFSTSTPDYLAGYLVMLLPLTLALFLQMPGLRAVLPLARHATTSLLGLALLFQLAALVATGSRFALVSLALALIILGTAVRRAQRHGLMLDRTTRRLGVVLGIGLVLAALVFAKPVYLRLTNPDPNSGAFRAWTWKGAARMAAANPVLGTGIGTWQDLYPPYALTGFTRAAHDSYLQMADECGIPALLALLATLGLLGASLARGLTAAAAALPAPLPPPVPQGHRPRRSPVPPKPEHLPGDHRLLLCGLLAALAGAAVQNLIDSDWYVFSLGSTFWTLAGLAAGIASPPAPEAEGRPATPVLLAVGSVAAAFLALTAAQGIGAVYAAQAQEQTTADPAGAARAYDAARAWDPLNAGYASDQGYRVFYARLGNLTEAEAAVRAAVALEPNTVNYRHLGLILQQFGRQSEAQAAFEASLRADPNSLDVLLDMARLSPLPRSLDFYRRVSDLELTPVGTVRALGEYAETKFAEADAVMGDEAAKTDPAQAGVYYARAARVLEQYADLGGSLALQQQALNQGRPDLHKDEYMRGLYGHVLSAWIALAPPGERDALRQRQEKYRPIFDSLVAQASKSGTL